MRKRFFFLSIVLCLAFLVSPALAGGKVDKSTGQVVYVSATWNDCSTPYTTEFAISRLIVRNRDRDRSITLNSVAVYGPDGQFVKELLGEEITLGPLASTSFVCSGSTLGVPPWPIEGGRPLFLVEWESDKKVNIPAIGAAHLLIRTYPDGYREYVGYSNSGGSVIEEK